MELARTTWTERSAEEFELQADGKVWLDGSGVEYRRVRGNPLLGAGVQRDGTDELFIVADGRLVFLRRRGSEPGEVRRMGKHGRSQGSPQRSAPGWLVEDLLMDGEPKIISVGRPGDYPYATWGSRDKVEHDAQFLSFEARRLTEHVRDDLAEHPCPPGFSLFDKPKPKRDAYSKGVDAVLAKVLGRQ